MNNPVSLTVGGLFSGIGGIELGLERAGMRVLWHCEADPFCQHILSERWPGVPCFPDVRTLVGQPEGNGRGARRPGRPDPAGARQLEPALREDVPVLVPYVDVLCGGFPCQDISLAGAGAGITGSRSGLWNEYARLIGELRPRYVLIENVAALLARGLNVVLADLAALGFDAEWDCVPASAVGAPHRRDRVWIVAYPNAERRDGWPRQLGEGGRHEPSHGGEVADSHGTRSQGHGGFDGGAGERSVAQGGAGTDWGQGREWAVEPDVGRVAHGVPARVDRLKSLGNAVVPQIPEWIGRRIIAWEQAQVTSTYSKEAVA